VSAKTETKPCAICGAIVKHTENASGDLVTSAAHRGSLHHMRYVSALQNVARHRSQATAKGEQRS